MSHLTYYPRRGDFIHFDASPSVGQEMAGPHFALVMSPLTYNKKTGMAIVLLATSKLKLKPESHPRYTNTQPIRPGMIHATRDNPTGQGLLFCDAVRQIDWRERSAAHAGTAPRTFVEEALDKLLSAMEEE